MIATGKNINFTQCGALPKLKLNRNKLFVRWKRLN